MGAYCSRHHLLCGGTEDQFKDVTTLYTGLHQGVYQDMTKPLQHYFISSGHNSYLSGNQIIGGGSGTDIIKKSLERGCRVIELDVYPEVGGKDGPVVKHGHLSGTGRAPFRECVQAVKEYAFVASDYPVILTLEDHCDEPNQDKLAAIMEEELSDCLHVCEKLPERLESPDELRGRVLLRHRTDEVKCPSKALRRLIYIDNVKSPSTWKGAAASVADRTTSSSVPEQELKDMAENMKDVVQYTADHLLRTYPGAQRVDSSNADPCRSWNLGVQIAALNWQDWRKEVWVNMGKFADNGGCGYVLKPEWMLSAEGDAELPPPRVPRMLSVRILSVQGPESPEDDNRCLFLCRDDLYVKLSMHGMGVDSKVLRTVTANNTSSHCFDTVFMFEVHYPELAVLLLQLKDEDVAHVAEMRGQVALPLANLREGQFRLRLFNEQGDDQEGVWISVELSWNTPPASAAVATTAEAVRSSEMAAVAALDKKRYVHSTINPRPALAQSATLRGYIRRASTSRQRSRRALAQYSTPAPLTMRRSFSGLEAAEGVTSPSAPELRTPPIEDGPLQVQRSVPTTLPGVSEADESEQGARKAEPRLNGSRSAKL